MSWPSADFIYRCRAGHDRERCGAAILFAQAAGNGLVAFLPLVIIMVIFYVLLILPAQRRQKKTQAMLNALKNGDKVVTSGGLYGTIVGLEPRRRPVAHRRTGESEGGAFGDCRDTVGSQRGEILIHRALVRPRGGSPLTGCGLYLEPAQSRVYLQPAQSDGLTGANKPCGIQN